MKTILKLNLTALFLGIFLTSAFARNCPGNLTILDEQSFQNLITISDETSKKYEETKKVTVIDQVEVEKLNQDLFEQISNDPETILTYLERRSSILKIIMSLD